MPEFYVPEEISYVRVQKEKEAGRVVEVGGLGPRGMVGLPHAPGVAVLGPDLHLFTATAERRGEREALPDGGPQRRCWRRLTTTWALTWPATGRGGGTRRASTPRPIRWSSAWSGYNWPTSRRKARTPACAVCAILAAAQAGCSSTRATQAFTY